MDCRKGSYRGHHLEEDAQGEEGAFPGTQRGKRSVQLARVGVVGALLAILVGGAPLLHPAQARAATVAPVLRSLPLGSLTHPKWGDDGDGQGCSVLTLECGFAQQTMCQPVVHTVIVIKKVIVPVVVTRIVRVFVPVSVMPTATPPPTQGTTKITVKVSVPGGPVVAPTATPTTWLTGDPPPVDPGF